MVQRVVTERVDDLDGSEAVETVRFGDAGRHYEIDLSEAHAAELDEFLAPYLERARSVDGGASAWRTQSRKRTRARLLRPSRGRHAGDPAVGS